MVDHTFTELSLIIVIAAGVSLVMWRLKQPLILGYILAGLLIGPSALNLIRSPETFETFSSIGIALLLFIIGLGLNISVIKRLSKPVFVTAFFQLLILGSLGYFVSSLLGFTNVEAIIIGLAIFFSSTIIIVKVLSDKKEQSRLHGQIAIGIILVEDIVATLALLFVAAGKDNSFEPTEVTVLMLKGVLLLALLAIGASKILPRFGKIMASNQELLFLFAISWGFGIASLFELAGFSVEVGALFAGVALASLPYAQEIGARLKPLRDFFVVLFFIVLGESLNINNLTAGLAPALILSAIVIVLKPAIITTSLGLLGYTKRVSFKAGINLSQISEFSIILVVLAAASGITSPDLSAIITLVAIITITVSTYLMHYDERLFRQFEKFNLRIFDREGNQKEITVETHYPLILFGYKKGGHEFVRTFKKLRMPFVVVDYDPDVIETLERKRIPFVYGDATDVELLDEVGAHTAKLIVSTMTDFEINQHLVKHVHQYNPRTVVVCDASSTDEALKLYKYGATYVMIPHHIGSEQISALINQLGLKKSSFKKVRDKHLRYLDKNVDIINLESKNHNKKIGQAILRSINEIAGKA